MGGPLAVRVMEVRRLTGQSHLLAGIGVAGELHFEGPQDDLGEAVARIGAVLAEVFAGIGRAVEHARIHPWSNRAGITVAVPFPADRLDDGADLIELALEEVADQLDGYRPYDLSRSIRRIHEAMAQHHHPRLLALLDAAAARGLPALPDDEALTLGLGRSGRTWPLSALPAVSEVDWPALGTIPVALVTGTNGKTTTTRMIHAMLRATGQVAAYTSTVGVQVGDVQLEDGDWSGPGGARRALRDPSVALAVLETARGGLIRRGLAFTGYAVGVITNVADDHYGDYGVLDRSEMAAVKAVVGHGVDPDGAVVLNAADPLLMAQTFAARRVLFARDPALLAAHVAAGGAAFTVHDGQITRVQGDTSQPITPITAIPLTFGGAAPHNVDNALAAVAAADALGLSRAHIAAGLQALRPSATDLPGRSNLYLRGQTTALLDFAHNPESVAAVLRFARAFAPAEHLFVSLGMPGDRTDADLRAVAEALVQGGADGAVLRELESVRRGRDPGEVPELLAAHLIAAGLDPVLRAHDDRSSVDLALAHLHRVPGAHTLVVLAILDLPGVVADLTARGFTPFDPTGGPPAEP